MPVGFNSLPEYPEVECSDYLLPDRKGATNEPAHEHEHREPGIVEGWAESAAGLYRSFEFQSFEAVIDFMGAMSETIVAMDHHPKWSNDHNLLSVMIYTQDRAAPGLRNVTDKDRDLAYAMSELYDQIA